MITSKQTRCARFCWAYVSKYPYVSAKDIAGAQNDYTHEKILTALARLEAEGVVKRGKGKEGYYQWEAVVPFVMQVPEWAR